MKRFLGILFSAFAIAAALVFGMGFYDYTIEESSRAELLAESMEHTTSVKEDKTTKKSSDSSGEQDFQKETGEQSAAEGETTTATEKKETEKATIPAGQESSYAQDVAPVEYKDVSGEVSAYSGSVTAQYAVLVNVNDKSIVYNKSMTTQTSPASTTKMMTALTALRYLDPEEKLTVGDEITLIGEGSSTAQLEKGDVLTVRQMVQGLMLSSGNDAAYCLAVNTARQIMGKDLATQDAIDLFVKMMNNNVKRMGLKNTNFTSPDGYDADNQYTTAYDLAMIAYEAIHNDVILDAVKEHSVYVKEIDATWTGTNELMNPDSSYYYDKAVGLKTGSTENAGKCLVSVAKDGKQEYLCVVMGDDEEGRWTDSSALLKYGFTLK